jgi:hypothetical protein
MKYKGLDIPPVEGKEWLLMASDASKTLAHHLFRPELDPNPWTLSRRRPKIENDGNKWLFRQTGQNDDGEMSRLNLPGLELGAGFLLSYTLRVPEVNTSFALNMRTPFLLADGREIQLRYNDWQSGPAIDWLVHEVGRGYTEFADSTLKVGGKAVQIAFLYTPNSVRIFEDGTEMGSLTVGPKLPLRLADFGNILENCGGMITLDVRNVYTMPLAFHPGPEISPFPAEDRLSMELTLNVFMEHRLAGLWTARTSDPMKAEYKNESLHITNTSGQYEFAYLPPTPLFYHKQKKADVYYNSQGRTDCLLPD